MTSEPRIVSISSSVTPCGWRYINRMRLHAVDLLEPVQQIDERSLADVAAPLHRVLTDERELGHAERGEMAGLRLDHIDRARPELAAHQRDRAERAPAIAPFGDLQVRPRRATETDAGAAAIVASHHAGSKRVPGSPHIVVIERTGRGPRDDLGDLRVRGEIDERIDLGQRLGELVGRPRDQTAGQHETLAVPRVLELGEVEDLLDGLPPGGVDEAAGVDDDDVGPLGVAR